MREKRFIIDYNIGSETRSVEVWAECRGDAERHLDGIKQTGRVEGMIVNEVPSWAVSLGLTGVWIWAQDLWRGGAE